MPINADDWKKFAIEFESKWNYNHCIGAIDGKHVNIIKPAKLGSYNYNYKKQLASY